MYISVRQRFISGGTSDRTSRRGFYTDSGNKKMRGRSYNVLPGAAAEIREHMTAGRLKKWIILFCRGSSSGQTV